MGGRGVICPVNHSKPGMSIWEFVYAEEGGEHFPLSVLRCPVWKADQENMVGFTCLGGSTSQRSASSTTLGSCHVLGRADWRVGIGQERIREKMVEK